MAYTLAMSAGLLVGGRLGDIAGRIRRLHGPPRARHDEGDVPAPGTPGGLRRGVRRLRRYEIRKSRSGGDPLILPGLFRKRAFLGGMATGMIYFAAFSGFGLIFNLHLQLALGYRENRAVFTAGAQRPVGSRGRRNPRK
ncbi:hypothetical protein GCM10010466_36000 [Planomonospora alba]|uniref:Uncharacterized protein n=1 Tax=Planomonospora alba TaxID=161354 RepID=A0ABP6NCV8_9ACTN